MQRRQATLREKLTEHYHKRDFKPKKESASAIGVLFFLGNAFTLAAEGFLLIFPSCFKGDETGWINCLICMMDCPPRSHHCTHCNCCILKRDHHCYFSGSCIGYHNQKAFLIFCIYSSLSCAYAACMQMMYLNQEVPIFYFPLTAIWQWLKGATSFSYIFVLIHLYVTVICWAFSVFFVAWQLFVIIRGQTSHEVHKQIITYRRKSIGDNLQSVLGKPLDFVRSLVIPLRMNGTADGINWNFEPKPRRGGCLS